MKHYHEVACVINNSGNRVGYLIISTKSSRAQFVNEHQFSVYCKLGEMQYFAWNHEKDTYEVFYNEEEIKAMGKAAKVVKNCTDLETYFSNDVILLEEHVALQKKHSELLVGTVLAPMSLPIAGRLINIFLFGKQSAISQWYVRASSSIKSLTRIAPYNSGLIVTITAKQLLSHSNDFQGVLINPTQLLNKPGIYSRENFSDYPMLTRVLLNSQEDKGTKQALSFFVESNERNMATFGENMATPSSNMGDSNTKDEATKNSLTDMNAF